MLLKDWEGIGRAKMGGTVMKIKPPTHVKKLPRGHKLIHSGSNTDKAAGTFSILDINGFLLDIQGFFTVLLSGQRYSTYSELAGLCSTSFLSVSGMT